jgi:hydrogenase nickel incorporation protein HypB
MCDTCGCNITGHEHRVTGNETSAKTEDHQTVVTVLRDLLSENDHQAAHNRRHLDQHGVLAINLMSSPGAGKTRLLEATITALKDELALGVIEGDLETENDAERIRAQGVDAVQISTGSACHLDAQGVHNALHQIALSPLDILFIENVGNLVCPASFDLGQHRNVTLLSVTEGDDKPAKYPVIFRATDLVLLTKTDLLPFLDDFDPVKAEGHVRALAREVPVLSLSARQGTGIEGWLAWLRHEVTVQRQQVVTNQTLRPALAGQHSVPSMP